jgi:P-type Cu+ transporter
MAEMVKDPVCGMEIDPETAAGSSEYEGVTYYFCAEACKTEFDAEPSKYVGAATAPEPMAEMPAPMPEAPKAAKKWWEFWK